LSSPAPSFFPSLVSGIVCQIFFSTVPPLFLATLFFQPVRHPPNQRLSLSDCRPWDRRNFGRLPVHASLFSLQMALLSPETYIVLSSFAPLEVPPLGVLLSHPRSLLISRIMFLPPSLLSPDVIRNPLCVCFFYFL